MTPDAARSQLIALVRQIHRGAPPTDGGDDLVRDWGLTSMQLVQLIVRIEGAFGIPFGSEPQDFDALGDLSRLAALVAGRSDSSEGEAERC